MPAYRRQSSGRLCSLTNRLDLGSLGPEWEVKDPERTRGRKYHLSSVNTLRAPRGQDNRHGMPAFIEEGRTYCLCSSVLGGASRSLAIRSTAARWCGDISRPSRKFAIGGQ